MSVSVNIRTAAQIASPDGQTRIVVVDNIVTDVHICSPECVLSQLLNKTVELIPLGGTRKETPGVRYEDQLLVTNLFTWSRREWWPVDRSFTSYRQAIKRIQTARISNIVQVNAICSCSTSMEFLDGYQLLDNRSMYTPSQHKSSCWADTHSFEEFSVIYQKVLEIASALHHQDVIHTDLTAFNILVNQRNEFKVIDLFSCITVDALGPRWVPSAIKKWIGKKIELSQIQHYLYEPALQRWNQKSN